MTNRRALDQCRREVDESRARPTVVDEPIDDSVFIVWPSIGRQLPPRSVVFDLVCFHATPRVRSDLMHPLAFDESAWLADQLVDRVCGFVRTWEPTTDWHRRSLTRSGRTLEWIVWRVATAADQDVAPLYEDEATSPWAIDLETLPRYGGRQPCWRQSRSSARQAAGSSPSRRSISARATTTRLPTRSAASSPRFTSA